MSELVANPTTKTTLDDMWSKRIHHYGQVNTPVMQASDKPLEYVTQSARGLKMISELVRDRANTDGKPSYVILHYPLMYESMVAGVAQALKSYPVDMLVAIGYTSYTDYGTKDCRMVPPVLHSEKLLEPSLLNTSYPVRLVRVVSAMVKLKKEHAATSALAVSFGMGGRWYTPTYPDNLPDTPGNGSLGQPCTTSSRGGGPNGRQITGIAEGCANKRPFDYDDIFQAEYLYNRTENMLFTFDTSASFRYKLYDTEGIDQDLKYNLAADNIQHEDFDNTCGRGPYSRMRLLKILAGHSVVLCYYGSRLPGGGGARGVTEAVLWLLPPVICSGVFGSCSLQLFTHGHRATFGSAILLSACHRHSTQTTFTARARRTGRPFQPP